MKLENKSFHIAEYFYNKYMSYPLIPYISKTKITPNMLTITNMLIMPITFYCAYNNHLKIVAFQMLLYQFFDNLDGNLARYKNMNSELGAKLDNISDFIFYNLIFIFLGWNNVNKNIIFLLVFLVNFYGCYATYFLRPRLRKFKKIRRFGIKKYFMKKGIIFGIDVGTIDIISSIFLVFNKVNALYRVLIILFILDIIMRYIELIKNEKFMD
ncbi:CDP-alcohol phosphatidyltransferase family protein [Clostridium butyricum]|uniref:CDP-alcohol phosphatidyltransferase family n=1 Tax=Clostridium butyricum E4 str. BoNT E BL5262 TaxID=632245 RepID=C4IDM4_CLOBU|nr:CDP-alcohol phosphatidyltransferase family protein [Clostridium butyricum]APF22646.1 CDP-alcohol phosphatidyltransferase family protein [Clostridium butyricum]EDT75216.1 putative CDP-alcohol phosphatidyltransferase [Clostridium butyricum 5521]EEP55389.1 CDP-alcohol phosphatidyltransferase family [Clostridium butyricum E4 str. BoNT E BL5262]NFL31532.1 CDP-alcohol phosphatidyltransferase family protein [Clostridium butyricum]NFS18200.1 CDP-alcohol phosphatidyltransferase family protein [Clost